MIVVGTKLTRIDVADQLVTYHAQNSRISTQHGASADSIGAFRSFLPFGNFEVRAEAKQSIKIGLNFHLRQVV